MKWAMQRQVFGKALIQQPVIRFKLGAMIAEIESVHSMAEDLTYQMSQMTDEEINSTLAGPMRRKGRDSKGPTRQRPAPTERCYSAVTQCSVL